MCWILVFELDIGQAHARVQVVEQEAGPSRPKNKVSTKVLKSGFSTENPIGYQAGLLHPIMPTNSY